MASVVELIYQANTSYFKTIFYLTLKNDFGINNEILG